LFINVLIDSLLTFKIFLHGLCLQVLSFAETDSCWKHFQGHEYPRVYRKIAGHGQGPRCGKIL